jgi:hypothetical protein
MGLDMYLTASNFFWTHEENESIKEARKIIAKTLGLKSASEIQSVKLNLAYWRKVNWIHNWFVENVQGGQDNCGEYYVTRDQLEDLKNLCDEIIASRDKDKAMKLLPPVDGFFFGKDTVEDNYYWGSLAETSNLIHDILSRPQLANFDFHYSSSW